MDALLQLAPPERSEHVERIRYAMRYEEKPSPAVIAMADKLYQEMPADTWVDRGALVACVPGRSNTKSDALALLRSSGRVEYDAGQTHKYRKTS